MEVSEPTTGIERLSTALSTGRPMIVGSGRLPDWSPDEGPPSDDLVVRAADLRTVLSDRDLAKKADPRGLWLFGAVVVGRLELDHVDVTYRVLLSGCHFVDTVTMDSASLTEWGMHGCHVHGDDVSLDLQSTRCDGRLWLHGLRTTGAVDLSGATVTGQLVLTDAVLGAGARDGNRPGISLLGENLEARSMVSLDSGFTSAGTVRLNGARVAGQLRLRGATLGAADVGPSTGVSLDADHLTAGQSVYLDRHFTAAGSVRFRRAEVRGMVGLRQARVDEHRIAPEGFGLVLDQIRADGDLLLGPDLDSGGAVRLRGAHVGGRVDLRGAHLGTADPDGEQRDVSLSLRGCDLSGDLRLDDTRMDGGIDARSAVLAGLVLPDDGDLPPLVDATGWSVGDVHGRVREDRRAAVQWLETQSSAQPWQELADLHDRIGLPHEARWLRYSSAVRSTRRAPWPNRVTRTVYRVTTGHGYYPLLALGWLAALLLAVGTLTSVTADDFTTPATATIRADQERGPATDGPPPARVTQAACREAAGRWDTPCLSPLLFTVNTVLPAAVGAQPWAPPPGPVALGLTVLRTLGWVFTAVLLAGVTGLLRRQT